MKNILTILSLLVFSVLNLYGAAPKFVPLNVNYAWNFEILEDTPNLYTSDIVNVDIDGDGDLDIIATKSTDQIIIVKNNGFPNDLFSKTISYVTTSHEPQKLEAKDIDNDGDIDIVSILHDTSGSSNTYVYWYENDGSENFTEHVVDNSIAHKQPYVNLNIEVADVDGDDHLEIFTTGIIDGVYWYENNGSESFTKTQISADKALDLIVTDIDGDNNIDVLFSDYINKKIAISEYDNGSFGVASEITSSLGDRVTSLRVEDIDGDLDKDIVSITAGENIRWHRNDGGSFITIDIDTTLTGSAHTNVSLGDVNNDGNIDIAVGNTDEITSGGVLYWYINDGSENFTRYEKSVSSTENIKVVELDDINNDGIDEIVYAAHNGGSKHRIGMLMTNIPNPETLSIYENNTSVVLAKATDSDGDDLTYSIFAGNGSFNSDDKDLFEINASGYLGFKVAPDYENPTDVNSDNEYFVTLQVLDTTMQADYLPLKITVQDVSEPIEITSYDGNASVSLSIDENSYSVATIVTNSSDASFELISNDANDSDFFNINALGELRFINKPDYESPLDAGENNSFNIGVRVTDSSLNTDEQNLTININNVNEKPIIKPASINFTYEQNAYTPTIHNVSMKDLFSIDIDNDGDIDIITPKTGSKDLILSKNNGLLGDGYTVDFNSSIITTTYSDPTYVYAKDLNRDNYIDIVVVFMNPNDDGNSQVAWYENDGNESFTEHDLGSFIGYTTGLSVEDIDKNGYNDIVVSQALGNGDGIFWYKNDGTTFTKSTVTTTTKVYSIVTTDIDNDKNEDIVALIHDGAYKIVQYEYNGTTFQAQNDLVTSGVDNVTNIKIYDIDNDGKKDIVSAQETGQAIKWHKNNGASFTSYTIDTMAVDSSSNLALGDIDLDGDIDFVIGDSNRNADQSSGTIFWYINEGDNQTFTKNEVSISNYNDLGVGIHVVDLADINNDDVLDIVYGSYYQDNVAWLHSKNQILRDEGNSDSINIGTIDDDSLTYSLSGIDADSFEINSSTGVIDLKFVPDYETDSVYEIVVHANDGLHDVNRSLEFRLNNINEAPVITSTNTYNVNENSIHSFTIIGDDPENATLFYGILGVNDYEAFDVNSSTGVFTFKSAPNYETKDTYTILAAVSDGELASDPQTITINIQDINEAPIITSDNNFTIDENTVQVFDFIATDPEDENLTYTISGTDANDFNMSGNSYQLKQTPDYENKSSYSIILSVDDNTNEVNQSVTININDINEVPIITSADTYSVDENSIHSFTITATDPESDTLTYLITNLKDYESFDINNSTGVFTFKSAPDFEQKDEYNITVFVLDGELSSEQNITINIQNTNDAPTLNDIQNISLDEDFGTASINLAPEDLDGDNLRLSIDMNDTSIISTSYTNDWISSGVYENNISFDISSIENKYGTVELNVSIEDPSGAKVVKIFTLTVNSVDDEPIATAMAATVGPNSVNTFDTFTPTFTDADNHNPITLKLESLPNIGSFESDLDGDNNWTLIDTAPFEVDMTNLSKYRYNAGDNSGQSTDVNWSIMTSIDDTYESGLWSNTATGVVTIIDPSLNNASDINITSNGSDINGTVIQIDEDSVSNPIYITFSDDYTPSKFLAGVVESNDSSKVSLADGDFNITRVSDTNVTIIITPKANVYGDVNITLGAFDGDKNGTKSFILRINSINDTPVAFNFEKTINEDTNYTFSSLDPTTIYNDINDSSQDSNETYPDLFNIISLPKHGILHLGDLNALTEDSNVTMLELQNLIYTPQENNNSDVNFTWKAYDGEAWSKIQMATIYINAVDDKPELNSISDINKLEDDSGFVIELNATDVENDEIVFSYSSSDESIATVSLNDGNLTVTPVANASGVITIEVNATANGETVTQSFEVNISAVDDAPSFDTPLEISDKNEDFADFNFTLSSTDIENNNVSYNASSTNTDIVTVTIDENIVYVSSVENAYGDVNISVKVEQDNNTSLYDEQIISFSVNSIDDKQVIDSTSMTPIRISFDEANSSTIYKNIVANDVDNNDSNISYSVVSILKDGSSTSKVDANFTTIKDGNLTITIDTLDSNDSGAYLITINTQSNGIDINGSFYLTIEDDEVNIDNSLLQSSVINGDGTQETTITGGNIAVDVTIKQITNSDGSVDYSVETTNDSTINLEIETAGVTSSVDSNGTTKASVVDGNVERTIEIAQDGNVSGALVNENNVSTTISVVLENTVIKPTILDDGSLEMRASAGDRNITIKTENTGIVKPSKIVNTPTPKVLPAGTKVKLYEDDATKIEFTIIFDENTQQIELN
jgi:hypothetical protein